MAPDKTGATTNKNMCCLYHSRLQPVPVCLVVLVVRNVCLLIINSSLFGRLLQVMLLLFLLYVAVEGDAVSILEIVGLRQARYHIKA